MDDLASLDEDLYNGLIFLKHYAGNPEDLSLNFTIASDGLSPRYSFWTSKVDDPLISILEFGVAKTINLIPNGSNIAVTRENRLQYIQLVSHYRLNRQIRSQSEAFFDGLSEMVDPKWLRYVYYLLGFSDHCHDPNTIIILGCSINRKYRYCWAE